MLYTLKFSSDLLCQGVDVVTFIDCLIEQEGKAEWLRYID